MDPNMNIHFQVSLTEQKVIASRAERVWRRLEGAPAPAQIGLAARFATFVARLKQAAAGRSMIVPAPATGQQGSPSAC